MKSERIVHAALITGVAIFMMAASASASIVTYNTNSDDTMFTGSSLTLHNSDGVAATLTFDPNPDTVSGVPSNINLGNFTLVCPTCSTQALGVGAFFQSFSFNLVVTDLTDNATGRFVGTSSGGLVYSDVSQLTVTWSPLQLGPGTSNALTGDFGPTFITTTSFSGIVAPNSGAVPGQTTVQAFVNSNAVPEPATLSLIGGALLGLGVWRRKRFPREKGL